MFCCCFLLVYFFTTLLINVLCVVFVVWFVCFWLFVWLHMCRIFTHPEFSHVQTALGQVWIPNLVPVVQ